MFEDRSLFLSFALEGLNQNNIIILQWRPKRFQFLLKVGVHVSSIPNLKRL
jgi:hypothetical protein